METGELEERILIEEDDPDARRMRVPFNFGIQELYTHLFRKGSNYQYIIGYPYIYSYIIDELSHTIDSSEYRHNYSFPQYYRNETYRSGENKIVNLMYLSDIYDFYMKDSFELRYNLFNRELELLETLDLTGLMQPSLKHLTMYVDEGSFIILSGDTIRHGG
ncbi:hypothetical protein RZS08_09255, partial [Arthrospira platensis SPKY1]|nr:hypothetical protein [Arthrospira platensis SPKY1]